MKVVTAEQMRALDRRAIDEFGIPGSVLMENAGRAVVEVMARECGPLHGKRVAVYCGSGNNGGDGFVAARYLALAGALPTVCMVGRPEALKEDAKTHRNLAHKLGIRFVGLERRITLAGENELIVDALFGTGIKEAPREPYAETIAAINLAQRPVVAIDIPSGVDADTGATPGEAVRATHTVTFGYAKLGLYLFPGAECAGRLHIDDIGFDWDHLAVKTPYRVLVPPQAETRARAETEEWLRSNRLLNPRTPNANKGDYGHVAVIAGSQGMVGAPAIVARAAQRTGAGLVTVLAPSCAQPAIAAKLDEQMTQALPDADGALSEAAFDAIAAFAEKATVLGIGPGLTTAAGTVALVQRILREIAKPIVLDADGLNALAQRPETAAERSNDPRAPLILTPHPGEAARLLGTSIPDVEADRIGAVRQLAERFHAVAVLKGRHTLIAAPNGAVAINTTGNPGMATGGMGDALTGILGGLLAQAVAPGRSVADSDAYLRATVPPGEVAALGVYLHGMAGDLAAARIGETGLVTGDLIDCIPTAIRLLEEDR